MERREFIATLGAAPAVVTASANLSFAEEADERRPSYASAEIQGTLRCRSQMRVGWQ